MGSDYSFGASIFPRGGHKPPRGKLNEVSSMRLTEYGMATVSVCATGLV